MATNDPLACDSTTRRDHRWYLRWAVNKFHLAPESKKPTEGVSEMAVGEDGGRRVVGLRKGRLASAVFEESAKGVHRPCHQPPRDD
ncbi:hypothetical protein FRC02_000917 [Tulasnella sp. 418]|nr:hypothetical protein FRC02_000917 [Tulasnella sp. 418]